MICIHHHLMKSKKETSQDKRQANLWKNKGKMMFCNHHHHYLMKSKKKVMSQNKG